MFLSPTKIIDNTIIKFPKIVLNNDATNPGTASKINQIAIKTDSSPTKSVNAPLFCSNLFMEKFAIYKLLTLKCINPCNHPNH